MKNISILFPLVKRLGIYTTNQVTTPTLTLPSPRRRLYEPEAVKGEGTLKEHYYSPSPGGRGLGGGGEKRDFLYY